MLLTVMEPGNRGGYSLQDTEKIIEFVSGDAWIQNQYAHAFGALNYLTVKMRQENLFKVDISRVTLTWFENDDMEVVEQVKNIMKRKVEESNGAKNTR